MVQSTAPTTQLHPVELGSPISLVTGRSSRLNQRLCALGKRNPIKCLHVERPQPSIPMHAPFFWDTNNSTDSPIKPLPGNMAGRVGRSWGPSLAARSGSRPARHIKKADRSPVNNRNGCPGVTLLGTRTPHETALSVQRAARRQEVDR